MDNHDLRKIKRVYQKLTEFKKTHKSLLNDSDVSVYPKNKSIRENLKLKIENIFEKELKISKNELYRELGGEIILYEIINDYLKSNLTSEERKGFYKKLLFEVTLAAPLSGTLKVNSPFGAKRSYEVHPGVDLYAVSGTNILAPADGEITVADYSKTICGGTIIIQMADGFRGAFCHVKSFNVKKGDFVKQGQVLGLSGGGPNDIGRGNSRGAHLHFTLRKDGQLVDPMKHINKTPISSTSTFTSTTQSPTSTNRPRTFLDQLNLIFSSGGGETIKNFINKILSLITGKI